MAWNSSCSLTALSLPAMTGVSVLSVEVFERRNFTFVPIPGQLADTGTLYDLNFCNITVTYTHPGWNDTINVQTLLPTKNWNTRFVGIGGGGLVAGGGPIGDSMMMPFMASGFAASTTDGGHSSSLAEVAPPIISWALTGPGTVNWPLTVDFASVTLHDTAIIGKSVTEAFYGVPPTYSYFSGGSTGGRQGHMLAQRYPDDYDGIVAAFPAINWVRFLWASIWPTFIMDKMRIYPRPCEFNAIRAAVVSTCDGLDGLEDGIISRTDLCDFEPHSVVGDTIDCDGVNLNISPAAADVVNAAWTGPRSSTGQFQWYGFSKGINLTDPVFGPLLTQCNETGTCEALPFPISNGWARHWVMKNPTFDMSTITHEQWDELFHASVNEYDSVIGSADPDLTAFKRRGGKMVTWHGTSDPGVPVNGSINYFNRVLRHDPEANDYYRLFLAPGGGHCFGCGPTPALTMDFIVDWVENGVAPDTLPAYGPNGLNELVERVMCLYPRVQHYTGGDPSVPSSFTCI